MTDKYEGPLFKIATDEGDKFVPGIALDECPGLVVTAAGVGRFTITHAGSGMSVCNGKYERCDNAIIDVVRLAFIAKANGFSWEEENPQKRINEIKEKPVPFPGATTTDKDGTRPMSIKSYIQSLRPLMPGREIDSPPWEDTHPINEAEDLLRMMDKL